MFPFLLNFLYFVALAALSPWLVWKALTAGKYRRGIRDRLFGNSHSTFRIPHSPVWFHGVSVGEVHLLRPIVGEFRRRYPDVPIVISSTTDTGFVEARKCFPDAQIIRWPFDFSWSVARVLDAIGPRLVVLAESELWPNFLLAAKTREIPVVVVNARMSPKSFRRLSRIRFFVRRWLNLTAHVAAQTPEHAEIFELLGIPKDRISVTGNVKYDGIETNRNNEKTKSLRRLFHIGENEIVWIAGSTAAPEEEICLRIYQKLQNEFPNLRLILVPRQKNRFDDVSRLIENAGMALVRRSEIEASGLGTRHSALSTHHSPRHDDLSQSIPHSALRTPHLPIILLDSIGELGPAWGLADIAFVGGSLDGKRGGQNMIEPAAYGAAVLFGPHTWNFRDAVQRLLETKAAAQIENEQHLESEIRRLLRDASERLCMGAAARKLALSQKGAAARTVELLDPWLKPVVQSPTVTLVESCA